MPAISWRLTAGCATAVLRECSSRTPSMVMNDVFGARLMTNGAAETKAPAPAPSAALPAARGGLKYSMPRSSSEREERSM